jgi:hypothetical protein
MSKTITQHLEDVVVKPGDHPYDGTITEVAGDYVHVRLAGGERKILHNVIIADHIDKNVLKAGIFCKVDKLYDRGRKGRFILTDILPQIHYGDYAGAGTGIPLPPTPSAQADCDEQTWHIAWTAVDCTYYELYWSASSDGSGASLLTQTNQRSFDVQFDTASPPKIYFAVKAVHGVSESNISAWVTDTSLISRNPLVAFGDSWLHGDVPSDDSQRRQGASSQIQSSTNHGVNWSNDFPGSDPPNTWLDAVGPTTTDLTYIQVAGDYLLARKQGDADKWRGWLWNGSDWLAIYDQTNLPVESYPIWMAIDTTTILVTCVADEHLYLLVFDDELAFVAKYDFGEATIAEVEARTKYLFPVIVETDVWYVAGRFGALPT